MEAGAVPKGVSWANLQSSCGDRRAVFRLVYYVSQFLILLVKIHLCSYFIYLFFVVYTTVNISQIPYTMSIHPKRIGIIGYGSLGQYLVKELKDDPAYKIVFVWNRTPDNLVDISPDLILTDLNLFSDYTPDLIIEVAHPSISEKFGMKFLQHADYFAGNIYR